MLTDRQIEVIASKIQMARRCGRPGDVDRLVVQLAEEGVGIEMDPTGWLRWFREGEEWPEEGAA